MRSSTDDGDTGVGVRATSTCTKMIIRATRTHDVLGEKGRRIRELTSVAQKNDLDSQEAAWNT